MGKKPTPKKKPAGSQTGKGRSKSNAKPKGKAAKKTEAKPDPLAQDSRVAESPGGGQVSPGRAEHDDDDEYD